MSDTTGWRGGGRCCYCIKEIDGTRYEIHKGRYGGWWLWRNGCVNLGRFDYLADAKRAAHKPIDTQP